MTAIHNCIEIKVTEKAAQWYGKLRKINTKSIEGKDKYQRKHERKERQKNQ